MKRSTAIAATLLMSTALMSTSIQGALAGSSEVTGSLVTPSGTTIKGYPVTISGKASSNSTSSWVTTTDETGKFKFDGLPAGSYVVTPGNAPEAAKAVKVESDETSIFDLFRNKAPTETDVGTIEVAPGGKLRRAPE